MNTAAAVSPSASRRRTLAFGAVAAAGALAGAGFAWWRLQPAPGGEDAGALWAQSFQTPQGQALPMAGFKGKPVLLNFWATWCPPCVEELPLIDGFFRQQAANGWQVVGLAIDQPSAVRKFLEKTPVSFAIGLAGLDGTELARTLGNTAGGLPFTVVLDKAGRIRERRMGRITEADLSAWARQT